MNEKWQKTREIFEAALSLRATQRSEFLIKACGEDRSMMAEVESLLSSVIEAGSVLETPFGTQIARIIHSRTEPLEAGTRLTHYEIIEPIAKAP